MLGRAPAPAAVGKILEEFWLALLSARPAWVAVAFALYLLALLAAGARWQVMVRAVGGRLAYHHATLATMAAIFVNNVTPTGRIAGEACRIVITRMKGTVSVPLAALASLGDRLTDVPPLVVMGLAALPALRPAIRGRHHAIALGAVIVVAALALLGPRLRTALRSWLISRQRELHSAAVPRRVALSALGWSTLMWLEDVLRIVAVGQAFDIGFTWPQAAALAVIGVLGGLAPTLGGVGVVEGGLVAGLVMFGLPLDRALAVTALERAISYGFSTCAGGLVVLLLGGRRLFRPGAAALQ